MNRFCLCKRLIKKGLTGFRLVPFSVRPADVPDFHRDRIAGGDGTLWRRKVFGLQLYRNML